MPVSERLREEISKRFPWMDQQMLDAYMGSWGEFESSDLALDAVRATDSYSTVFAGNIDDYGQARMSESDYFAAKARFDATLESVGVNPTYFQDEWVAALENEVSPNEIEARLEAAYERVSQNAPDVRRYYAENFNIELTDEAILASAISPRIGTEILERRIAIAEIGGTAKMRGFDVGTDYAESLVQYGLSQNQAQEFFGEAAAIIPAMEVLGRRHADPDDPFDLEDVSSAFLFDDPDTRKRIRRVMSQEASMFTGGTYENVRDRSGGVSGLASS